MAKAGTPEWTWQYPGCTCALVCEPGFVQILLPDLSYDCVERDEVSPDMHVHNQSMVFSEADHAALFNFTLAIGLMNLFGADGQQITDGGSSSEVGGEGWWSSTSEDDDYGVAFESVSARARSPIIFLATLLAL
eukprot:CAMPEP_0170147108 /NCGR_PEP_ID=MMETSP0033_2-20121228/33195_1 /TAXON_ID=195969 /ORGANISM="Dolichomastix tenuilepis, Strain CCMP3274" /LENGTH=133 /DNA_ID=CAMNT_0010383889 /DNA_START=111 /DNA_END=509 /DNA_ORIENTATION=-